MFFYLNFIKEKQKTIKESIKIITKFLYHLDKK